MWKRVRDDRECVERHAVVSDDVGCLVSRGAAGLPGVEGGDPEGFAARQFRRWREMREAAWAARKPDKIQEPAHNNRVL